MNTKSAPEIASVGPQFIGWGAVMAGAVLAASLSFFCLAFTVALVPSATSLQPFDLSPGVIAWIAVLWIFAQKIGPPMIGGYVGGRMRSRSNEANNEAKFRDGLQGALVWGVEIFMTALLFFVTVGVAGRTSSAIGMAAALAIDPSEIVLTKRGSDASDDVIGNTGRLLTTAASFLLSLGAAWWAARKGGQHRDDFADTSASAGRLARGSSGPRAILGLARLVVFVPGAVGFLLGLITAPLIIGFRMGLGLVNTEFVQVFTEVPERQRFEGQGPAVEVRDDRSRRS